MVAPALVIAPTLSGILGAGLSLAGKAILKAFLAKKAGDFLGKGGKERPEFAPENRRRQDLSSYFAPQKIDYRYPLEPGVSLESSPILQAYFGGRA